MLYFLIGYMWLFIHRPFEVWPVIGPLHIERIYILAVVAFWMFCARKKWTVSRLNVAFMAMVLAILVSWKTSPYPEPGAVVMEEYMKVTVFYVLVIGSVAGERQLRYLLLGYLLVMGLYMSHSFREFLCGRHVFRMGIARMIGVDTTHNDPNTFAATILYSLPLTFPFWAERLSRKGRLLLLYYTVLSIVCILLTGSRSALVGMMGLGLLNCGAIFKSRKLLVLLVVALPLSWAALPSGLQNRFWTLVDPSYGPKNAQQSAEGRSKGFYDGVHLWTKSPLTGFGPGSFPIAAGHGFQAHQLYGQVLGELGTLGTLALGWIVIGYGGNHLEMRRLHASHPYPLEDFPFRVSRSVMVSIALLLLMGFGGHNLYRYTWLWFGAFQSIALECARAEARVGGEDWPAELEDAS